MFHCVEHCGISDECRKFKSSLKKNPTSRSFTKDAWDRCEQYGVDRNKLEFIYLNKEELESKIESNKILIDVARPYIDHINDSLAAIPHLINITDKDGWIIDIRGNLELFGGKDINRSIGANCSEKFIGNNGVGTCLAVGKPVIFFGEEHYVTALRDYTGIGVPIRNNNRIIGALGIKVPDKYGNQSRLQMTTACVKSIEQIISNIKLNPFGVSDELKISQTSELIATIVHDLKNPLSVIRGLGELGKLSSESEITNSYFKRIIKKTDEMNNLIVELLSIFKPQKLKPMNVSLIINDVLEGFKPVCKAKGISLNLIYKCNELIEISETLFKRAIENLLTNAVQASKDQGILEIKTELLDNSILITIKDKAGGIDESIRENLFQPFTYSRSGGTGLGLFMVYHAITNTHRGEIWFDTVTGYGTTFFIKLPVYQKT